MHQFQGSYCFKYLSLKALGILEHITVNWRRQNNIPDSDGVKLGQPRKRSDTVSTTHSDSYDQKRSRLEEILE
jgi:hypothetical protein